MAALSRRAPEPLSDLVSRHPGESPSLPLVRWQTGLGGPKAWRSPRAITGNPPEAAGSGRVRWCRLRTRADARDRRRSGERSGGPFSAPPGDAFGATSVGEGLQQIAMTRDPTWVRRHMGIAADLRFRAGPSNINLR
ncbi:hypothetical protein mvi_64210 (plasmid) [Methylobacterium indicum]|uniref:Uncharacterized protein n=1 Tax=Methylobacterium indicum TaxID=1775910 RepID=A0A8H8X0P2_9HYPH|nr:hypothetical protein mvi_64210 [Methylobacterium indicum]